MLSDRVLLERLGPVGSAFFGRRFRTLTEIQRQAIEPIMDGQSLLLSAATASGKTEALCAPLVARLMTKSAPLRQGIRMLVVAPTRALVNDLFSRLNGPLTDLGWECGRQTSDHRDKRTMPDVLITTPESLDSMLVRDGVVCDGRTVDHLLAGVEGVFIDEVHLFDGTTRGDQLSWLLARLARLRSFAAERGLSATAGLQVCGASATVAAPEHLARRLLGADAHALLVHGTRSLEVLEKGADSWTPLVPDSSAVRIREQIAIMDGESILEEMTEAIWRALRVPSATGDICRKLLVFVPTRRLCDQLSVSLATALPRRRAIEVLAHHGSLAQSTREQAETRFAYARDAVLVATTTLEVGVDIGNVDAVVLVGPPPDTGSLLQRVGRAGRRTGITRILPIARDRIEQAAFGSLLANARDGMVDDAPYARRWSVYVQQVASFIAQAPKRSRTRASLLELAHAVWPEAIPGRMAGRILDYLAQQDELVAVRDSFSLGTVWCDLFDSGGGGFHGNLDAAPMGRPVVDASTGEIIAHVQGLDSMSATIDLGGQRWKLIGESGEILLKPILANTTSETFRYSSRRAPTRYAFARHVLSGLGYALDDAPIIDAEGRRLWLHCGGSAYERVLLRLLPNLRSVTGMDGLALNEPPDPGHLEELARQGPKIREIVADMADQLTAVLAPGPWHASLPEELRREVVLDLFGVEQFFRWLSSRRLLNAPAGTEVG